MFRRALLALTVVALAAATLAPVPVAAVSCSTSAPCSTPSTPATPHPRPRPIDPLRDCDAGCYVGRHLPASMPPLCVTTTWRARHTHHRKTRVNHVCTYTPDMWLPNGWQILGVLFYGNPNDPRVVLIVRRLRFDPQAVITYGPAT